jgi:hypothetical protein
MILQLARSRSADHGTHRRDADSGGRPSSCVGSVHQAAQRARTSRPSLLWHGWHSSNEAAVPGNRKTGCLGSRNLPAASAVVFALRRAMPREITPTATPRQATNRASVISPFREKAPATAGRSSGRGRIREDRYCQKHIRAGLLRQPRFAIREAQDWKCSISGDQMHSHLHSAFAIRLPSIAGSSGVRAFFR